MAECPGEETVTRGESFEAQVSVEREMAAAYLHEVAGQLEAGTDLTMTGDDWEIPFEHNETVELEYEVESTDGETDEPLKVELEIEFTGSQDSGDRLTVR